MNRRPARTHTRRKILAQRRLLVDRRGVYGNLRDTRFVPLYGDLRELGFKARAAPATVSGVPYIENHWICEIREGDEGTPSREPGNLLAVVAHRTAGGAEREEIPSGDGVGRACAGLRCHAHRSGLTRRGPRPMRSITHVIGELSWKYRSGAALRPSSNHMSFRFVFGRARAAPLLIPLTAAWATPAMPTNHTLQAVVVTATRIPTPQIEVASSVTIVTDEDISARHDSNDA